MKNYTKLLFAASMFLGLSSIATAREVTARVVDVSPIYVNNYIEYHDRQCFSYREYDNNYDDRYYDNRDNRSTVGGTVAGSIIGGILGNQIGSGSGRDAATIGGVIAGGAIGNRMHDNRNERQRNDRRYYDGRARDVTRCDIYPRRNYQRGIEGYLVTYRLGNGRNVRLEESYSPRIGSRVILDDRRW